MDNLILASQSPRRQQLLSQAGYRFITVVSDVDETNPPGMPGIEVPEYLAQKKAKAVADLHPHATIIAASKRRGCFSNAPQAFWKNAPSGYRGFFAQVG